MTYASGFEQGYREGKAARRKNFTWSDYAVQVVAWWAGEMSTWPQVVDVVLLLIVVLAFARLERLFYAPKAPRRRTAVAKAGQEKWTWGPGTMTVSFEQGAAATGGSFQLARRGGPAETSLEEALSKPGAADTWGKHEKTSLHSESMHALEAHIRAKKWCRGQARAAKLGRGQESGYFAPRNVPGSPNRPETARRLRSEAYQAAREHQTHDAHA